MDTNVEELPYIEETVTTVYRRYNPNYGMDRNCVCGHPYYRHFDSYEDMAPVGCKYCDCRDFVESKAVTMREILLEQTNKSIATPIDITELQEFSDRRFVEICLEQLRWNGKK